MAEVKLYFEAVWLKEDGDCSICVGCGDMIFGNKYSIGMKTGKCDNVEIITGSICESCADEIKKLHL